MYEVFIAIRRTNRSGDRNHRNLAVHANRVAALNALRAERDKLVASKTVTVFHESEEKISLTHADGTSIVLELERHKIVQ